ncbi:nitrogenase molybdenum-iron protein alpha chain, partial [bacterium]|nr:nitrogenase molybdenum-iron protein alpha chain [bacterium]
QEVYPRTNGKTAMLFLGGSRAHHYQELFKEMGIKTLSAGYEFGHRDDYEGRQVIPTLKVDADSRNIEEIEVEADPLLYKPRKTEAELAALTADGLTFKDYEGLNPNMEKGSLIIDDLNQYEAEKLVELMKPDLFCAGIKEKYSIQKLGVPM